MRMLHLLKRCLPLLFIARMIWASPAMADGIYVTTDLKHARGEHTLIVLNEEQIKDVERLRKVVLTDEQMKPLRAVYKNTPPKMAVLSSRWDSCTCGIDFYAIWCRVGELDVPHSELKAREQTDKYLKEHPPQKNENEHTDESPREDERDWVAFGRDIILDSKGDMYLEGRRISEEALRGMIDEISVTETRAKEVYRYISFDLPPPIGKEIDERISELVQRIHAYCKEEKVELSAMGMRLE